MKNGKRGVPLPSKVQLRFGFEEILCETVDVSLDGILVKSPRTIPAGTSLQVSTELTQRTKPVVGAGSIVRVLGGNHMGIHLEFTWTDFPLRRVHDCRNFSCR